MKNEEEIKGRTAALNNTIKNIEKQFGKGSIMKLGEAETQKWADNCPDWYSELAETLNKDGYRGTEIVNKYLEFANDYIAKN